MTAHPKIITVGELRHDLTQLLAMPDDTEVFFGSGNLSFYRIKNRGPVTGTQLLQVEFNEVYTVVVAS